MPTRVAPRPPPQHPEHPDQAAVRRGGRWSRRGNPPRGSARISASPPAVWVIGHDDHILLLKGKDVVDVLVCPKRDAPPPVWCRGQGGSGMNTIPGFLEGNRVTQEHSIQHPGLWWLLVPRIFIAWPRKNLKRHPPPG
ncbi:MAG: hypothetical protein CM15mP18_1680 [Methanobacteriota archaeon]|nr:MAG: hypothetical protein CM15mP18_1680 [Euryarchaeota archaeon]